METAGMLFKKEINTNRLKPGKVLLATCSALVAAGLGYAQTLAPKATDAVYAQNNQLELWSDASYGALLVEIDGLHAHGLTPEHYGLSRLKAVQDDRAKRDRLATAAWLMAAAHLRGGKSDPVKIEPHWTLRPQQADLNGLLASALETGRIAGSLDAFAPKQPIYTAMKAELVRLRSVSDAGILQVEPGATLKSGDKGARIAQLRARLDQLGWLSGADAAATDDTFDPVLLGAVEGFQASEGLEADGVVGAATLRALNRGPAVRIEQLRVNMERFRWLPADLGRRHLRANIASFDVTAFENGKPARTHLTIVGKPFRATPVFSDEVEYIDFNPWWETPTSLARADKLPLFQRDPGAVSRLGFQVLDSSGKAVNASTINWNDYSRSNFPYRIRQAPGPLNALGQVKIMFPNSHNIYIHDTPSRGLFAQRQRAFSSGCLRTQEPLELAKWLLEETPGWNGARVDTAVASGNMTRATLSAKVPVHILYMTVVSDQAQGVRFLDDIYQRDGAVLTALNAAP